MPKDFNFGLSNFEKASFIKNIKFDLGFRSLIVEWKKLFSTKHLKEDLVAGISVAFIAIPLALAIALASEVSPQTGLFTAILGGILCALFGGTNLAVSGPAIALAVIADNLIETRGFSSLLYAGIGCGILQLITGFLGLGRLSKLIPIPVVMGFTAGLGGIIFIDQLPRAFGLPPAPEAHVFDVLSHFFDLVQHTKPVALVLSSLTIFLTYFFPRIFPKLPAPLLAVLMASVFGKFLSSTFHLDVETMATTNPTTVSSLYELKNFIPIMTNSNLYLTPPIDGIFGLLPSIFVIYAIATLETLLSALATDKMSGQKHDADQEMIGQGISNIITCSMGGLPVTSVIARSSLNIQAGAKTRRASIIHALTIFLFISFFSTLISQIPFAVLAGLLLSVTLRILDPREVFTLWKVSRIDAITYAITFLSIVCVDLFAGVQAGVFVALLVTVARLGKVKTIINSVTSEGPVKIELKGPLTFVSLDKIEGLNLKIKNIDPRKLAEGIVFDFSEVTNIDSSGGEKLVHLLKSLEEQKIKFALRGLNSDSRKSILAHSQSISRHFAFTENDLFQLLNKGEALIEDPLYKLFKGVEKFKHELSENYDSLFQDLADSQNPHTLFITCSDSRINPNLITSSDPGDLFIVRNVGNIIPIFGSDGMPAEGAAVEYAIGALKVKHIIVCGHSNCGAMNAVMTESIFNDEGEKKFPSVIK